MPNAPIDLYPDPETLIPKIPGEGEITAVEETDDYALMERDGVQYRVWHHDGVGPRATA